MPMTDDPINANLTSAIDSLARVLRELAIARDTLQLLRERGEDSVRRLSLWRDTLIDLGTPLHFGTLALHRAIQDLAAQIGDDPSEPEFSWWLTGVPTRPYTAPVTPEMAQAEALLAWITPRIAQLPPRWRTALTRDLQAIGAGRGGALAGLESEGFLAELGRPQGGRVGLVVGLGPLGLSALRGALGVDGRGE